MTRPTDRWRTRLLLTAAVGVLAPGAGRAFYFDYGPGSGATPPPTLVPAGTSRVVSSNPSGPVENSRVVSIHTVEPAGPPPDYPNTPNGDAPEPATGVAGLIGLGVVGLARWRRK